MTSVGAEKYTARCDASHLDRGGCRQRVAVNRPVVAPELSVLFTHPTASPFNPGIKCVHNKKTGLRRYLFCWHDSFLTSAHVVAVFVFSIVVNQARSTDDSSSRTSTSVLSPESVGKHQKSRSRGSGDLRPEAIRPEGGSGGHRRSLSGDSTTSSVNLMADDVPLPHPPMANGAAAGAGASSGASGGDMVVPKLGLGDAVKMPVRAAVPARAAVPRPGH